MKDPGAPASLSVSEALMDPAAYPHRPDRVERMETHISWVFLAGDRVYKVKKPVDFGFLDFTDLAKRKRFCEEEVRLNRRLAPDLYLGVVGICRWDGGVRVNGTGEVVEYAVEMRRLPQDRMLDRLLEQGAVGPEVMHRICGVLVDFYRRAETGGEIDRYGEIPTIRYNTDENFAQTEAYVHVALSQRRFDTIRAFTNDFYKDEALFRSRIQGGRIRDCHGDLHSGNICVPNGVVIYDCIEFNRRFRYSDVAADVAFLAMDLDFKGHAELSRLFVREFAERSGDADLLRLLDFYKCYRAYVRGKILCFSFDEARGDPDRQGGVLRMARRYFALAERYTGRHRPARVVVVFGLIATGKSTLADALGLRMDAPVLSADRIRKVLAGIAPTERRFEAFGEGIYSAEMTRATYGKMAEDAGKFVDQGQDVVLDASFRDPEHRAWIRELEQEKDCEVFFVWCTCPEEEIRRRLARRLQDGRAVSDGRWEIYTRQKAAFALPSDIPADRLMEVDGGADPGGNAERILEKMGGL